jgi:uncharacterized protein (TIGR00369 family)
MARDRNSRMRNFQLQSRHDHPQRNAQQYGKAHGGIAYSLADSAFGFFSNTNGRYAVSIDTSINHIEALEEGDYITATATLESLKNKVGFYIIEIKKKIH